MLALCVSVLVDWVSTGGRQEPPGTAAIGGADANISPVPGRGGLWLDVNRIPGCEVPHLNLL